jgi:hypothetical protein
MSEVNNYLEYLEQNDLNPTSGQTGCVRINPEDRGVMVDVSVDVDQTWNDETSLSVNLNVVIIVRQRRKVFSDFRNFSVDDFDVADLVDVVGWIDDTASKQQNSLKTHFLELRKNV